MNAKRTMQFLSIFALIVWGGLFIYFYLAQAPGTKTPLINQYVNSAKNFDTWVLVAGMGLIVLAVFNLITFRQKSGCCSHEHAHGDSCDHDHHHEEGHDHSHEDDAHDHDHDHDQTASGLAFSILILIVPVLVAANYSQGKWSDGYYKKLTQIETRMRALAIEKRGNVPASETQSAVAGVDTPPTGSEGEDAEDSGGNDVADFTMEDLKRMVPQNEAGSFLLEVPEIYYTAGDPQLMKVMTGIDVEFTAQVMHETVNNPNDDRLRAFRLLIECCAADARPLSMPLEFTEAIPAFEEMKWFKLVGKLKYVKENDEWAPVLQVKSMDETAEQVEMLY